MADDEVRKPHGLMGYATCLHDPRWDDNEFVQNVGHALAGLVPLRMSELSSAGEAELMALAQGAAKTITEKGDVFQFQADQRRKGWKPSGVLSALVNAYAVLALNSPDEGVTFFAFHCCFWEHEGCPKNNDR
ncbi:hypothetical protein DMB38_19935 [Streptomyces sp. WAC 06738]|uniref:hypothetical protein n=1 Tax=Streptomyces sp. WAC 06738 TaxID=2203210 RepID=UPI000F702FA4|nr:hypothetical protein [Streptomyces sp. WAC 06738]AZM47748.1 hypothetical protein DMB38_19935 [Streptomyces sp. WAC 06738]